MESRVETKQLVLLSCHLHDRLCERRGMRQADYLAAKPAEERCAAVRRLWRERRRSQRDCGRRRGPEQSNRVLPNAKTPRDLQPVYGWQCGLVWGRALYTYVQKCVSKLVLVLDIDTRAQSV